MADNSVTLVGNITRDPEMRFTNTGQAVTSFGLAVNRRWQNRQSGEWDEQVSFFDITAWGSLGENTAGSLNKGNRVIVTGRLQQRSYETQAGEKRSVVEVVADEIGPSLRWANAKVERNERTDQSGGGGAQGGGGGGGGQSRPVQNEPSGGGGSYGNDEEPF
jgi:single-strand DNA-binding protein